MTDLIARLESAEGPSRELDAEIARLVGAPVGPREIVNYESRSVTYINEQAPAYTSSVDAALTLVTEGMRWCVDTCDGKPRSFVEPSHPYEGQPFWGNASTPALALVIAALRAKGVE